MGVETLGQLAALGCAATWAMATLMFGKAAATVDPRALNLWKCLLSAVLLGVTALVLHDVPSISARDSGALVASAVLGLVLADTGYLLALRELGAARGVLFVSLVPVCTSLLAAPVLGEEINGRMVAGMALTLGGVTLVVRSRVAGAPPATTSTVAVRRPWIGVIGGVLYCTTQAGANVLTKGTDASLSPLALSVVRLGVGAFILALWLLATARGRDHIRGLRPVLGAVSVATIIGTFVGLLLGTYALRTVSAGVATTLVATTPLFALVFARVMGGENPTPRTLVGAVLALLGVALLML